MPAPADKDKDCDKNKKQKTKDKDKDKKTKTKTCSKMSVRQFSLNIMRSSDSLATAGDVER